MCKPKLSGSPNCTQWQFIKNFNQLPALSEQFTTPMIPTVLVKCQGLKFQFQNRGKFHTYLDLTFNYTYSCIRLNFIVFLHLWWLPSIRLSHLIYWYAHFPFSFLFLSVSCSAASMYFVGFLFPLDERLYYAIVLSIHISYRLCCLYNFVKSNNARHLGYFFFPKTKLYLKVDMVSGYKDVFYSWKRTKNKIKPPLQWVCIC